MRQDYSDGAYGRMVRLLGSVGIYRLDGTTAVEKELRLYADRIGELYALIDQLAGNCFVDSVTQEGFLRYVALYALPANISREKLQTLVRRRLAVNDRDFTAEGVRRCMASGGFEVELAEDFQAGSVTVTVRSDLGAFGTLEEKEAFLRECLPCHLNAVFVWELDG